MRIDGICASNFKTFRELNLDLGPYDVLIGTNAAGKSNFIDILKFVRDIALHGLENAVSLQGGGEYVQNICMDSTEPVALELRLHPVPRPFVMRFCEDREKHIEAAVSSCTYRLVLAFEPGRFSVADERIVARCRIDAGGAAPIEGEIVLGRNGDGAGTYAVHPREIQARIDFASVNPRRLAPQESLLESPFSIPLFAPLLHRLATFFRDIGVYDFDPKISRKTTSPMGMAELEPDGSNLAIVLRRILENAEERTMLLPLISEILPFVEDVNVERLAGASLVAGLKEIYCGRRFTPASLLSEGTINLTALVIALYFERKSPIVLEEPVRNVHPHLASRIVEMIRDVSERLDKQVIISTHSPEIVKYAGAERMLLVKRDRFGFSSILRPKEKEEIRAFLVNMGIEELYVQNLL